MTKSISDWQGIPVAKLTWAQARRAHREMWGYIAWKLSDPECNGVPIGYIKCLWNYVKRTHLGTTLCFACEWAERHGEYCEHRLRCDLFCPCYKVLKGCEEYSPWEEIKDCTKILEYRRKLALKIKNSWPLKQPGK